MIDVKDLYQWCSIPADDLPGHAGLRTPFRMVADSLAMGELMASDFVEEINQPTCSLSTSICLFIVSR